MSWVRAARPLLCFNDKERVPIIFLVVIVCRSLLTTYLRIRYDDGTKMSTAPLLPVLDGRTVLELQVPTLS